MRVDRERRPAAGGEFVSGGFDAGQRMATERRTTNKPRQRRRFIGGDARQERGKLDHAPPVSITWAASDSIFFHKSRFGNDVVRTTVDVTLRGMRSEGGQGDFERRRETDVLRRCKESKRYGAARLRPVDPLPIVQARKPRQLTEKERASGSAAAPAISAPDRPRITAVFQDAPAAAWARE